MPTPIGTAKTITVIISDTHIGSSVSLSTPQFLIHTEREEEAQTVDASNAQKWLWVSWVDFWDYVKVLAVVRGKHRKHRIVTVHLGDIVDGLHHNTTQGIGEVADQMKLAETILNPVRALSDGGMYITYGTDAHNGGAGSYESQVAQNIGAEHDWEYTLDIEGGALLDVGHHGRAGQRDWTSAAAGIAAEVILDYAKAGEKIPEYIFRGHVHVVR